MKCKFFRITKSAEMATKHVERHAVNGSHLLQNNQCLKLCFSHSPWPHRHQQGRVQGAPSTCGWLGLWRSGSCVSSPPEEIQLAHVLFFNLNWTWELSQRFKTKKTSTCFLNLPISLFHHLFFQKTNDVFEFLLLFTSIISCFVSEEPGVFSSIVSYKGHLKRQLATSTCNSSWLETKFKKIAPEN